MDSYFFINTKNLIKNLNYLPSQNICAMVKADAYGHGLKTICKTLQKYVKFFGVANLSEALEIRKFNSFTSVLIVGMCEDFQTAIDNNISVSIENISQLEKILKITSKNRAKIHIKINTGMNRFGVDNFENFQKLIKKIKKNEKKLNFEGIFTHFSTCDCDKQYFFKQLNLFKKYVRLIPKFYNPIIHIGGSGVFKNIDATNYKNWMFRVGINLYTFPLPVLQIKSKIIKIFTLQKNQKLGYSNGHITTKPTRIGIIPLGYYDGINRGLSNKGYVKIKNQKCKIIGNICMDVFFIDLTNTPAQIGDQATIFWDAELWAKQLNTIPYEILTSLKYKRLKYTII